MVSRMQQLREKRHPPRPLELSDIHEAFGTQVQEFKDTCFALPIDMSRSWWIVMLAQVFAKRGYAVRTELNSWHEQTPFGAHVLSPEAVKAELRNVLYPSRADPVGPVDLVAWPKWGRWHSGEGRLESGREPNLPPIYALRLYFGQRPGSFSKDHFTQFWNGVDSLSEVIRGPLTTSMIIVNYIRGDYLASWAAAQSFDHELHRNEVICETSSSLFDGGVYEPLTDFQIMIATKTWNRDLVANPDYLGGSL